MLQLLLLGADAPAVQQQLALMLPDRVVAAGDLPPAPATENGGKKRSMQQQDEPQLQDEVVDEEELRHAEACALGRVWRALCLPLLSGFDGLILLRKEGLPFADRQDPLAVRQLQLLVSQQHKQQRRLAGKGGGGKKHAKQQQQGGPLQVLLLGAVGGGGGSVQCAAPKNSRAILRNIPEQVRRGWRGCVLCAVGG